MSDPYVPPSQPADPPPPGFQPGVPPPPSPTPPPNAPAPPYPPGPSYPPAPPYAPGPSYAPGPTPGAPPPKKGNKGCLIAVVVVLVLLVGATVAVGLALNWAGDQVQDAIGEGSGGACPFVSDAEATEALGAPSSATYFSGFFTVMNITDSRVLPDQPSCILQQEDPPPDQLMPGLGRAVRYQGSDAAERYQQELTKAQGITEDRGGGISVSTEDYFNRDVPDLGDEAFCTKSSGLLAGVLARRGDTLVYVAISPASDTGPGIDASDPDDVKLGTDDRACDASVVLAGKILG